MSIDKKKQKLGKSVKEIKNSKQKPLIKIVTSEKWDSKEAGLEISEKLAEIKGIRFLILFSTIHYKKFGGFQKLLDSVYLKIPENTPLVGGNVLGFMTKESNFSHGVVCMAVLNKELDFSIGIGKNTKRNPVNAAEQASYNLKKDLENSKYKNKFILSVISGTEVPKLPFSKPKAIIKPDLSDSFCYYFLKFLRKFFQKGFGKEDEVLEKVTELLPDFDLIGLSTVDNKMIENYQFYNKKIMKNSLILLGVASNFEHNMDFASGAKKSKIDFKITKISKDKQIIHEINGKPALDELLRLMGWKKEMILDERRWTSILPRFPLGFYKDDKIILRPLTLVMGHSIAFMSKIESKKAFVVLMSGLDLLDTTKNFSIKNIDFGFFISCAVRGMGLGKNVETERLRLKEIFKYNDFLVVYTAGEAYKRKNKVLEYLNESLVFFGLKWKRKN